jgi:hypothetical protein
MLMDKIKSLWERIEKYAIYVVLFAFFASQLISLFVPSVAAFMNARGALLLIAAVLLFIFRYLEERLGTQALPDLIATSGFSQGVIEWLGEKKTVWDS